MAGSSKGSPQLWGIGRQEKAHIHSVVILVVQDAPYSERYLFCSFHNSERYITYMGWLKSAFD